MSGTAKEAERAQEARRRAAEGDQQAADDLGQGETTPVKPPYQQGDGPVPKPVK